MLINERGMDAVSPESVALVAATETSVVESHFPDSRSLIRAAIRFDEGRFNSDVRSRWEELSSPTEQLLALLRHLVLQYDWSAWIQLWSAALREEWARELRREIDGDYHGLFEDVISRGVEGGDFRVAEPVRTAVALATIVDALAVQATLGDPRVSPHFMLDTCVECASRLLDAPLESPSLAASRF